MRLQAIETWEQLTSHPKLGASWKGFAFEQSLRVADVDKPCYWRGHARSASSIAEQLPLPK